MTIIGNLIAIGVNPLVSGGGVPPFNTVAPMVGGPAIVGGSLGTTNGDWTGSPIITFTYQWYRGATPIIGATFNYYDLVEADAGNTTNITCQVTATNIYGSATATSNVVAQILDFDANEFINAASITNQTQKDACNQLVISLKGYGIWTKMKAIYPFVGGTASAHKFNLKDPRNLNAAFRLVFNGGVTHSSTGVLFNGTNGYADSLLTPSTSLSLNSTHVSVYSRTNVISSGALVGLQLDTAPQINIFPTFSSNLYMRVNSAATAQIVANTSSLGLFIANRVSSTQTRNFQNAILRTQTANSTSLPTQTIQLSRQGNTNYGNFEQAFASIGNGLTDTEALNLYTAVQAYQTTLGRQV